jgi:hypothetical protein
LLVPVSRVNQKDVQRVKTHTFTQRPESEFVGHA